MEMIIWIEIRYLQCCGGSGDTGTREAWGVWGGEGRGDGGVRRVRGEGGRRGVGPFYI